MRDNQLLTIGEVEDLIITAIEDTDTDDKMGPQSSVWYKVYGALQNLSERAKERSEISNGT